MKPSFCIGFQVHHPLSFVEYDPENLNEHHLFERMANDVYFPFLAWYQKRLLDYPQLRGMISLSGVFFDYCDHDTRLGEELLDQWRRVISTQRVEVLSEPYHHSLHYLDDSKALLDQIHKHHDTVHNFFGVRPKMLRMLKQSNYEHIGLLCQYIGFEGILLDRSKTCLGEIPQRELSEQEWNLLKDYAPIDTKGNVHVSLKPSCVLGVDKQLKKELLQSLLQGESGDVFADKLLEDGNMHAKYMLLLDIEDLLTSGESVEQGLLFLDQFIVRLLDRDTAWYTPHEWKEESDIETHEEESSFDSLTIAPRTQKDHNLQQTALQELQSLVEAFEEGDSEAMKDIFENIQWLGKDEHFHAMVSKHSPYDSPYQAFEMYVQGIRQLKKDLENFDE